MSQSNILTVREPIDREELMRRLDELETNIYRAHQLALMAGVNGIACKLAEIERDVCGVIGRNQIVTRTGI